jgi:hypothetical protein
MLVPLQVIDGFLLNVNVGDALLVGFVLGVLALVPMKSRKLLTVHVVTVGILLLWLPGDIMYNPADLSLLSSILQYKLAGIVMLVIAPVLYATADR